VTTVFPNPLSAHQLVHHFTVNIGKSKVPALESVGQFGMIDAETMENRCVQVVNVHRIARDVVAEVVRLTDCDTRFYSSTR